ncbi:lysophosphatidylcholine acyltransferase [Raphidocelis subcapitata]|uniref:Lysophosphatidylcholine acyltransferase n=1 Tax=Raphidocelis subcapitata TaxID=307507 RepID=A0A2V0PCG0_9CHLO|nr:lysophosphatidylcholine acyltransferase [Raphidocelis subcapitata]|eukprot:GBF97219.1 lysophosphatidylcholine acyltransferase [Raphidocelis subcapitata]
MVLYDTYNSPFIELQTPLTAWEIVKIVIMLPTIPFRILFIACCVFGVAVCNTIAIWGCDLERPLPRWRRRLVELSSQGFCGAIMRGAGFWCPRVKGLEHWEEGKRAGAIGVFNHVSYIDAFAIVWALCPAGLTFEFTRHIPVLGRGIMALQNIYLPKKAAGGSMVEALRRRSATPGMPPFVIAPEGTLSQGRCLLTFKTGAFVPGLPVVPVLFRYKLTGHNPGWGVINPKLHLLRLMCQLYNHVTVECLPVYHPSPEEEEDPQLYAANVRRLMAAALGVPMVDQDRAISQALEAARVRPSLDGRRVVAPPGVLDAEGRVDLGPWLAKQEAKRQEEKKKGR